jgi:hypothetical protein
MDCWIEGRAALPHPTAPPARDGSIYELEDLGVVYSRTPPQFIRRMDWKFADAVAVTCCRRVRRCADVLAALSPVRQCAVDMLVGISLRPLSSYAEWTGNFATSAVLSLCCRWVWRCAGDVLAAVAVTMLSPGVMMCWMCWLCAGGSRCAVTALSPMWRCAGDVLAATALFGDVLVSRCCRCWSRCCCCYVCGELW